MTLSIFLLGKLFLLSLPMLKFSRICSPDPCGRTLLPSGLEDSLTGPAAATETQVLSGLQTSGITSHDIHLKSPPWFEDL